MNDYKEIINALTELKYWIREYEGYCSQIDDIIGKLSAPMTDFQRERLKHELSGDVLFHPKCLGDVYVKDFPKDGTSYPWFNYLSGICKRCQEELE